MTALMTDMRLSVNHDDDEDGDVSVVVFVAARGRSGNLDSLSRTMRMPQRAMKESATNSGGHDADDTAGVDNSSCFNGFGIPILDNTLQPLPLSLSNGKKRLKRGKAKDRENIFSSLKKTTVLLLFNPSAPRTEG